MKFYVRVSFYNCVSETKCTAFWGPFDDTQAVKAWVLAACDRLSEEEGAAFQVVQRTVPLKTRHSVLAPDDFDFNGIFYDEPTMLPDSATFDDLDLDIDWDEVEEQYLRS